MRFMLQVTLPVEDGNRAAREGTFGQVVQSFVEQNQPEAVYFVPKDGKRSLVAFLDIPDESRLIAICEPFYAQFNASIEILPAMTGEGVLKGVQSLRQK